MSLSHLDESEFEATIAPHLPDLQAFALRLCRSPAVADDLLQEALTRAWTYWDRFERGSNARAWMRRIVFNTFINDYRRRRREHRLIEAFGRQCLVFDELVASPIPSSSSTRGDGLGVAAPGLGGLGGDLGDEVRAALERLPNAFRQVVLAVDLAGLSYEEAACKLGCPQGTIMSRLHRARAALRLDLREYAQLQGVAAA